MGKSGKRLLIYRWGSLSEPMLCKAIKKLDIECVEFSGKTKVKDFHADAALAERFMKDIHRNEVGAVISYDYFPMISMICEINGIPYISWIYDCPLYTLLSRTITNNCNYIFCFDRIYTQQLVQFGAKHCFHYPLAGETGLYRKLKEMKLSPIMQKYKCDISFVGNLYNDNKNYLRWVELSPYAKGYIEGLVTSQLLVYGYNFLKESLSGEIAEEIIQKCNIRLGNEYLQDERQIAADTIGVEVSAREREAVLCRLGEQYPVKLYTSSKLPDTFKGKKIKEMGYADYQMEVPLIFYNSKINLNITSKTIESGIPQRVFDILSCGGFCLTNYQPEIAEYFTDGEELVMYTDMNDLVYKAGYYLEHQEEREQIARNGYRKIVKEFDLEARVKSMLEIAWE